MICHHNSFRCRKKTDPFFETIFEDRHGSFHWSVQSSCLICSLRHVRQNFDLYIQNWFGSNHWKVWTFQLCFQLKKIRHMPALTELLRVWHIYEHSRCSVILPESLYMIREQLQSCMVEREQAILRGLSCFRFAVWFWDLYMSDVCMCGILKGNTAGIYVCLWNVYQETIMHKNPAFGHA